MKKDLSVPLGESASLMSSGDSIRIAVGNEPIRYRLASPTADFVFVVDTTGSMNDKIDGLIRTCERFTEGLRRTSVDWQVAIVAFGDLTEPGDTITATPFSKNVEVIKRLLRNAPRNSGGGNDGESSLEAMKKALTLPGYRPGAIKVLILLTDEPALISTRTTPAGITASLRDHGAIAFVISEPIGYFKDMASLTGGAWFQISGETDFLSVLERFGNRVSEIISEVQQLAGGDVRKYLELKNGE